MPDSAIANGEDSSQMAGAAELVGQQRSNRATLLIVFLVVVTDLLGFALVMPLLPRFGEEFLKPLLTSAWLRGVILGSLMASFSAMQFIFAPIWGRLSDRIGRRPILLLGLIGSVVFYTLFGIASEMGSEGLRELGLILLFVSRIGAGIAGATLATAQAVIADSTTPEKRSHGMALIGAAFGIGFFVGPLLGAAFGEHRSAPGFAAAGFSLIALTLGAILLPETWRPGVSAGRRNWFNLRGFQNAFAIPLVGALILTFFLSTLAFGNFETTLAYLTEDLLSLNNSKNFLVFAYVGLVLALAQVFYRRLARQGTRETTFMIAGSLLMIAGMLALCAEVQFASRHSTGAELADSGKLAITNQSLGSEQDAVDKKDERSSSRRDGWMLTCFLVTIAIAVVGFSFMNPSINSLVSRRSDPGQQGEILGVNASANSLSRILGPMAGVSFYYVWPTHTLPYLFATGLLVLVLALSVHVRRWSQ